MAVLDRLFVYGTLRRARDGSLHPLLINQVELIDSAYLPGKLYLVGSYPGAVLTPAYSGAIVHGEIYRLLRPHWLLRQLDEYEECSAFFPKPHEYSREQAMVSLPDNRRLHAWFYNYQRDTGGLPQIKTGDYAAYLPASHIAT